ncbi:MAG: FAD-binding oxidoreductase, partial [Chitinophagales bacterium]
MLSYWEKQSFLTYDFIVVGSGVVGLSAALSLREQFPSKTIAVFERGWLPTGASTKNAGFACIGSLTELISDAKILPKEKLLALTEMRFRGLRKLRQRCGDTSIDYRENGSYELLFPGQEEILEHLTEWNETLRPLLKDQAFSIADGKISDFRFQGVKHLIRNHFEGEINSGKLIKRLLQICHAEDIEVKTGMQVEKINDEGHQAVVIVADGKESLPFKTSKAIICTNAFAQKLLPNADIEPGRGQVLITKPLSSLPFKGTFHFDEGYYYFREIDGRVLFGGGRNLDFETEKTTTFAANPAITAQL